MASADIISSAPFADPEFIPGTVQLVDKEAKLAIHHAHGNGQDDIVLIPTPSDHPDDPLNWSSFRKHTQLLCISV